MEISRDVENGIIGDLVTREKYRFAPDGVVAEAVRDAFKELRDGK